MEEKIYRKPVVMNDGTTQIVEAVRSDMVKYMKEHKKGKMICDDTDELFNRYAHAFSIQYNKEHKKPKGPRGGARDGAGRKTKEGGSFRHGFKFGKKVHDILLEHSEDMTAFVEQAILFYTRRDG